MKNGQTQKQLPSLISLQYFQHPWILFKGSTYLISLLSLLFLFDTSSIGYVYCQQHLGKSFICFLPHATTCLHSQCMPIAYNNTFQFTCKYLLVFTPTFHHQGLVITLLWQVLAQCSKDYQMVNFIILCPRINAHILSQETLLFI